LKSVFLSLVIPAYNEEVRLPNALEQAFSFLQDQRYSSELIVVENGSRDRTLQVAQAFAQAYKDVIVLHEEIPGKGGAVKRGVHEARGQFIFVADVDFSMPVEQIPRFMPPASSADITIASREAVGSKRYNEPAYRHFTGRIYNFFIRLLLLHGLQDTQCGFKCYRAEVAEDIFSLQSMSGWSFDVELLVIARRRGYSISEIGIPWYFDTGSKISVRHDSLRMFLDLLTIRRNLRRGLYDPQKNLAG
jgi:dolichyl-phosphate beta-glucosyltransferase